MEIGILEMPAEQNYAVQLDGQRIEGSFKPNPQRDNHFIISVDGEEMKMQPCSREGAAALLVYRHFERERKTIIRTQKKQAKAVDESS